jgi:hypothetical protein
MKVTYDLNPDEAEAIDEVFYGDRQKLMDSAARLSANFLALAVEFEYTTAISGAMRWPDSREAVILKRVQVRYA